MHKRKILILVLLILVSGLAVSWRYFSPAQRHIDSGIALLQSGQAVAAASEWQKAAELDPNNAQAWELLGDYHQNAKNWPAALSAFQRVQTLAPNTPKLKTRLATCYFASGDIEKAQQSAKDAFASDANDVEALQVLSDSAEKLQRYDEHLLYLRKLAALKPDDTEVLLALAKNLSDRYEYEEANTVIARLLKVDDKATDAYFLRGTSVLNQEANPEKLRQAEKDLRQVLALDPAMFEAHRALGRVYMKMGEAKKAVAEFEAVGAGRPYAAAHWLELSNAYRQIGQTQRADSFRQRFTQLKQLNANIQNMREGMGREPQVFRYPMQMGLILMRCVEEKGDGYNLFSYRFSKDELKSVIFYLETARSLRPNDQTVQKALSQLKQLQAKYLQQATSALERKDFTKANQILAQAILLDTDNPDAQLLAQKIAAQSQNLPIPGGFPAF